MEDVSFWRDRERRFLAMTDARLMGMRSDADIGQILADNSDELLRILRAPEYTAEHVGTVAGGVGHVAGLVLRGEYVWAWNISGKADAITNHVQVDHFKTESALSARGADLVAIGLADDEAVDRWLDALADPHSPYMKRSGGEWIDDLAAASAAHCAKLAVRAYDMARAGTGVNAPQGAQADVGQTESAGIGLEHSTVNPETPAERRAAVDAYIEEVYVKTDRRITRKDIWKAARYRTRSEFERWQRCDPKTTPSAHQRFMRVFTEKRHLK